MNQKEAWEHIYEQYRNETDAVQAGLCQAVTLLYRGDHIDHSTLLEMMARIWKHPQYRPMRYIWKAPPGGATERMLFCLEQVVDLSRQQLNWQLGAD